MRKANAVCPRVHQEVHEEICKGLHRNRVIDMRARGKNPQRWTSRVQK